MNNQDDVEFRVSSLQGVSGSGKDWLVQVVLAQEESRFKDLDDLHLFAARLLSRLSYLNEPETKLSVDGTSLPSIAR